MQQTSATMEALRAQFEEGRWYDLEDEQPTMPRYNYFIRATNALSLVRQCYSRVETNVSGLREEVNDGVSALMRMVRDLPDD